MQIKSSAAIALIGFVSLSSHSLPAQPADPKSAATAPSIQESRQVFANYGLSLVPPSGWTSEPCPASQTIASWTRRDQKTGEILAEITVKWAFPPKPGEPPPDREGAAPITGSFAIGTSQASAFQKESRDKQGVPSLQLECSREPLRFVLQGKGTREPSPNDTLLAVAKTVQWIPIQRVASSEIKWTSAPVPILNGQATVRLPSSFRHGEVTSNAQGLNAIYSIENIQNGKPEFSISFATLNLPLKPPGLILEKPPTPDFLAALGIEIQRAISGASPVSANPLPPPQLGAITVLSEGTLAGGKLRVHATASINYDKNHIIKGFAITLSNDKKEIETWDKAFTEIVKSVRFSPSDQQATSQPARQ